MGLRFFPSHSVFICTIRYLEDYQITISVDQNCFFADTTSIAIGKSPKHTVRSIESGLQT